MSDLEWHPASEEYCETILELGQADVEVIQARVAERLGVTRPAVSGMIRRLGVAGLVQVTAGIIELTPAGRSLADRVVRRRRLAEQLLVDVLGLDPDDARHEAGKWEHVISATVEDALARLFGLDATAGLRS